MFYLIPKADRLDKANVVDATFIATISNKEKELTHEDASVKDGPTDAAQHHQGERLTGKVVSDVAKGEVRLHPGEPTHAGGPAAIAQSFAAMVSRHVSHQWPMD